jgi:hypothetical protein
MRNGSVIMANPVQSPQAMQQGNLDAGGAITGGNVNNVQANTTHVAGQNPLVVCLLIFGLYIAYWYNYNTNWKEGFKESAVMTFFHWMISVGIAALLFFNLGNIFLTKMTALKVPILSPICGSLLTLFSW